MSTSILYHGFKIIGYKYLRTVYKAGAMFFHVFQERVNLRCPECGSRNVNRKGSKKRNFRTLPIGNKPVWISFEIPRVECFDCGTIRQVKVRFADPNRSYTKAFERYVLDLSKYMTISDVAKHLGIPWIMVKDIQKRNLKKRFDRPKLKNLKTIAIDEISIGKRHRYLTMVLDLKTGAVVFVGDGKGADALEPFWKQLGPKKKNRIKAVAIDMSPAYIGAVMRNLPNSTIVFDHFHVIKLFNERLSNYRRELYNYASTTMEKEVLKGTRWLLLKNPENLDENKNEKKRLQEALDLNKPLATAYYMKEELRLLWAQPHKEAASNLMKDWIARAQASKIPMLMKFAKTLAAHRTGILAYYDYPISTGPLEGTNNKIKTMKRKAYGFRDIEFFKLKIKGAHETRYALVG